GVPELVADDRRRVCVMQDVVLEVGLGLQHVSDDPAEERDVGPGPDRDVHVRGCAGAAEARIDVNDLGAAFTRAHGPAEADRVRLSQVGALNEDAVRVLQILLKTGGATAPERGPQTGDRARVSYAGLVLD